MKSQITGDYFQNRSQNLHWEKWIMMITFQSVVSYYFKKLFTK